MSSDCCSTGCKCGSGCGCTSCGCCKYSDPSFSETTAMIQTFVVGFGPQKMSFEVAEMGAEGGGCKCGADCSCYPCTCK